MRSFYGSPVAASEQESQDLASSLVLFFREEAAARRRHTGVRRNLLHNYALCICVCARERVKYPRECL